MIVSALLAAGIAMAPPQASSPRPGEVRSHKDWVAGCDNLNNCAAVALIRTPPGRDDYLTLRVGRSAGPSAPRISLAQPRLSDWLQTDDETVQVWIEGGGEPIPVPHGGSIARADVHDPIDRLLSEKELRVVSSLGHKLGAVSLAGSSAMLRYVDAAQGRVGRSDALVAKGNKPPPPILSVAPSPVVEQPASSSKLPFPADEALKLASRQKLFCDRPDPEAISTHRLDDHRSLVLITQPCSSGAYNYNVLAFTIRDGGYSFEEVDLALPVGMEQEDSGPSNWNLTWDRNAQRLFTGFRGRGIGDCGVRQAFAWDGTRFRLVEQSEMPECGGVQDFITTWRALVR